MIVDELRYRMGVMEIARAVGIHFPKIPRKEKKLYAIPNKKEWETWIKRCKGDPQEWYIMSYNLLEPCWLGDLALDINFYPLKSRYIIITCSGVSSSTS